MSETEQAAETILNTLGLTPQHPAFMLGNDASDASDGGVEHGF